MSHRRMAVMAAGLLAFSAAARAQDVSRAEALAPQMDALKGFYQRLPEATRNGLSAGAQNMFHLARNYDRFRGMFGAASAAPGTSTPFESMSFTQSALTLAPALVPGRVSDPKADRLPINLKNEIAGFTQSETSTAWCGLGVGVAFNDSGSVLDTVNGGAGLSFNGYSASTDGGKTFHDQGFLPAGPTATDFLSGDGVLACTSASTFYEASLLEQAATTSISVSTSSDGGVSYANPVVVVSAPNNVDYFLDKEWLAADPANNQNLYVTFTDFDNSGTLCKETFTFITSTGFGPFTTTSTTPRPYSAIALYKSANANTSWSFVAVVDSICDVNNDGNFVQGSQVIVDNNGDVDVAWIRNLGGTSGQLRFRRYGASPLSTRVVSTVVPAGVQGFFQGFIRNTFFPSLAIDRSAKATRNFLYLTWNDGRRNTVGDIFGTYAFGDVVLSRSTDGGVTWPRSPVKVNNNPEPTLTSIGTDQFMPGMAVDANGLLGVCYYSRQNDPSNFLIDRYCAKSVNAGTSFSSAKKSGASFTATVGQDNLVNSTYLGDYDSVATDFLKTLTGFQGAYGDNSLGNQDVKFTKF